MVQHTVSLYVPSEYVRPISCCDLGCDAMIMSWIINVRF